MKVPLLSRGNALGLIAMHFKLQLHRGLARENRVGTRYPIRQLRTSTCFNRCILHRVWLQLMANNKQKLTEPIHSSVSLDQRLFSPMFTSSALLFDCITTTLLRLPHRCLSRNYYVTCPASH